MQEPPTASVVTPGRLSDRALFARAASDEAAFAEIVHRYREPLRRHAARYVGDADAEDVVQQALVNASLALRREPDRDIEPKPWLYRVTTNAAIDHRRALSARPLGDRPHEEPELDAIKSAPGSDPHDVITGRESVRSLVSGIQGLAPNQRRAATARFLEGRSHVEIASELGVSKGAARELISRARRNLRETIPALSPVPLFVKLRESLSALFAGSASVPAAKLATGAAVAVVAAGAGGVAIKNAVDGGTPATPAGAAALKSTTTAPKLPHVAPRPRPTDTAGGAARSDGRRGGNGGSGGGGTGSGSGASTGSASAAAVEPAATGTDAGSSGSSTGSGGSSNPVQDVVDDVGATTEQLGLPNVTDQVTVPNVTEQLGVDAPQLPNLPGGLGGGN